MRYLLPAMFIAIFVAASAQAGFMGQEVTTEWIYPSMQDILETHNFLVSTEVELIPDYIQNSSSFSIDIGDDYIFFKNLDVNPGGYWQDVAANGWRFLDKNGTIEEIVGFTIGETTGGITGLDPEDLVFTADSVFANFGDSGPNGDNVLWGDPGSTIRLDIVFIPEPASLLLILPGILLLRKRTT